jgi:hypothetical protein
MQNVESEHSEVLKAATELSSVPGVLLEAIYLCAQKECTCKPVSPHDTRQLKEYRTSLGYINCRFDIELNETSRKKSKRPFI